MIVGIFGAGRNGSTLLMRLLDGSPGLWVYPIELNFLSNFAPRTWRGLVKRVTARAFSRMPLVGKTYWKDRYARSFDRWVVAQTEELNRTYVDRVVDAMEIKGNPAQLLDGRIGRSLQSDLFAFLDAVRSVYDDRDLPSRPLFAFKSIEVGNISRYEALFPEMRFVHIVRHPQSNYASLKRTDLVLKQKPFWFQGGDILRMQLEARWIPHVRFILDARQSNSARHFAVKYEDLCEHPETLVNDICRWLGVDPPSDPSLQTVLGGKRMSEVPASPSKEGIRTPPRVVANMAEEFGYEDILTEGEKDLILVRTYHLARQLGYFSEMEGKALPNKLSILRKWILPDPWELMNARSKLRLALALISRRSYICSRLLFPSSSS